ncbi:T9SS type A sorting domain-containing protein [Adhaeribacter soli]|uniref:T9SS type A sorting domain-containing protein n=1 Tax=Adhaeribacter soli TaxID=2607655 RepID=A0A5N1INN4_9BACT|nr:T9SS type A sorting domain-containing protein [Adhaeribacter soli]KAA9331135.1 T9SS type A sorting domain-containing protein [Adhaeribacter soli]
MKKLLSRTLILLLAMSYYFSSTALAQSVPELIYYKFDSPGTTVQNLASAPAGTNPAPISGATIGGAGQFGSAFTGNGNTTATNSVNTGWAPNLGSGSWTISLWLNNIPSSTTLQYFFGDVNTNSLRAFTGGVADPGGIRLVGGGITAIDMPNVVSNGPVVIHYVHDATAGNIKAYVNGVLTVTSPQTAVNLTGTGPFLVGGYSTLNGLPSGGLMDEFRFYNRALSAAEVAGTWNQSLPIAITPNDAGVTAITAPGSPVAPGNQNVQVTIKNYGTAPLTSAQIGWKVGNTPGTTFSWTGNLAPNAVSAPVTIGSFNFPNGNHTIKTWTTSPNGATDGNNYNDSTSTTITACNTISGTFTIDKNSPASATNYISFAAALQGMNSCGISGPVTFNVVAGTGPYNEQVTLTNIAGASATNTITFNGNGNTISFASTTADRAVVRLDGTDHVTFSNFIINASDLTFGWGIHLLNGADNNTISNNTINIASTSTTESNSVGIVLANSTTSVTTAGNTGNNNIISGNTINGAYKGIHLNGVVTGQGNNQILNNTVLDFYADGIKVNAAKNTLVEGNNIHRPTRTTTTTFTGIEVSGSSEGTLIRKNRIHNSHDATTSKTGTVYGIYFTGADAPVGAENVASNNLIYNINNTSTIYGIYNSSSDGAHYFHNTISLDNTANTGTNRGFYQTTTAANVKFINNIVSIVAGTSGAKHTLYFGSTTSTITSNNNVLHLTGGSSSSGIGFYSSNQPTLTAWQAVNSAAYDQNSVAVDPQFTNAAAADFTPTNLAVNNIGQGGTGITNDFAGISRNPNAPDPGAYEFMNNTTDVGITAITSPNSVCGLTATETVTVVLTNFGTNPQSNIPVSYSINGGNPVTATYAGPLAPGANVTYNFTVPANLSTAGGYTFKAYTALTGDMVLSNDTTTKAVSNSLFATLPISLDFETNNTGLTALKQVVNSNSTLAEDAGASSGTPSSTKGLVMAGVSSSAWTMPLPTVNPWTMNPNHLAGVYLCFNPVSGADSLILRFDLKQLYKDANRNTNFRVTVNGTQVGPTYNPPFDPSNPATPIVWNNIRVDLSSYIGQPSIEVGLESSVKEAYAGGNGTANLIDNVSIISYMPTGLKANLLQSQLNVFPNPSNGTFKVDLPQGKTYELTVTDLTGKVIMTQSVSGGVNQLQLNKAAKGIYLLKVKGENGTATRKLIIE